MIIPSQEDKTDEDDSSKQNDDEETLRKDLVKHFQQTGLNSNAMNATGRPKRKAADASTALGEMGQSFRSKKARGDMKKKGKMEPYAYIPLDPKQLSKRNKSTKKSGKHAKNNTFSMFATSNKRRRQ